MAGLVAVYVADQNSDAQYVITGQPACVLGQIDRRYGPFAPVTGSVRIMGSTGSVGYGINRLLRYVRAVVIQQNR